MIGVFEHEFTVSRDQGDGRCHWCSLPCSPYHRMSGSSVTIAAMSAAPAEPVSPNCEYAACRQPWTQRSRDGWRLCTEHYDLDRSERAGSTTAPHSEHHPDQQPGAQMTGYTPTLERLPVTTPDDLSSLTTPPLFPPPILNVELVEVGDLEVDRSYQRELNERRIRKYKGDFQPIQVGILEVSRRGDGSLFIVDGQHRAELVLQLFGLQAKLPALVYEGWTVQQEAERFGYVNKERVQVTPLAAYKADRAKGAADVQVIDRILAGVQVRVSEQAMDGTVQCVTELRSGFTRYGEDGLTNGVELLFNVWGPTRDAFRTSLVASACWVLHTYGSAINEGILVDTLKAQYYTALTLYKRALSRRDEKGGDVNLNVSSLIVEAYNTAVPKTNRLPLPTDVRPTATKRVNDARRLEELQRAARDARLAASHVD